MFKINHQDLTKAALFLTFLDTASIMAFQEEGNAEAMNVQGQQGEIEVQADENNADPAPAPKPTSKGVKTKVYKQYELPAEQPYVSAPKLLSDYKFNTSEQEKQANNYIAKNSSLAKDLEYLAYKHETGENKMMP